MRYIGVSVVVVIILIVAYFVWDGFVPRQLDPSPLNGGAIIATPFSINMDLLPLDPNRKYIAVRLDNPTDMIIRSVTIAAQIKVGADTVINIPETKCVVQGSTDLRLLANTHAKEHTCVVPLSIEKSNMIPVEDFFLGGGKVVDRDKVKLEWTIEGATGHA